MVNKHYPQQFKADAVALYRSRPGATIALIADDLGVNRETLRSWVRADDQRRGAQAVRPAAVDGEAAGSVEDENARLRRRRSVTWRFSHCWNCQYTVCQGGKSTGSCRHEQPER